MPIYNFLYNSHIDIQNNTTHLRAMTFPQPDRENLTMKDLIEARHRYQRMLDALGYTSRIDRDLRAELIETIDNFDRKIGDLSQSANKTIPPLTSFTPRRCAAG